MAMFALEHSGISLLYEVRYELISAALITSDSDVAIEGCGESPAHAVHHELTYSALSTSKSHVFCRTVRHISCPSSTL